MSKTKASIDSTTPLVDIGANLTNSAFRDDFDKTISRAEQAGIKHIIITGTNLEESRAAIDLAKANRAYFSTTAGIHPHDAKLLTQETKQILVELSSEPLVKAIGECGLDFNRNFSTPDQQVAAFELQIELAIELQLPLFLHERDAFKTQWEMLRTYRDQLSDGVIHCFTGDKQQAFNYLDLDLHLGITGWICDERRGYHLHEFVGDIPPDRLMIETDAPYLMPRVKPKPALKSSRRNEPCTLPYVLEAVAKHTGTDEQTVAQQTTANAVRFFRLDESLFFK